MESTINQQFKKKKGGDTTVIGQTHSALNRDQKQRVQLEDHTSSTSSVLSVVPRGTVLDTFLIFIGPLRVLKQGYRSQELQDNISTLVSWAKECRIMFHVEICEAIQIYGRCSTISTEYIIHNYLLESMSDI